MAGEAPIGIPNVQRRDKIIMCRGLFPISECVEGTGFATTQAHHVRELSLSSFSIPNRAQYKTQVCPDFDNNFCPWDDACDRIHGDEMSDPICRMYGATGRCYFPNDCPFEQHPNATVAAPYTPPASEYTSRREILTYHRRKRYFRQ